MAAIFEGLFPDGTQIVIAAPSSAPAYATPCPWLPVLAPTTPRALRVGQARDERQAVAHLERPRRLEVLVLHEQPPEPITDRAPEQRMVAQGRGRQVRTQPRLRGPHVVDRDGEHRRWS